MHLLLLSTFSIFRLAACTIAIERTILSFLYIIIYLFFFVFTFNMSLCRTLKNPVRCELMHLRCSCCMQFKHTSCHIATPKRKTITHTNYETTIKLAKYTRTMLPLPLQVHCGCLPLPCCHSYAVRRIFLATRNTHHTFFFGAMPPTNVTVCCMYVCMCDFP